MTKSTNGFLRGGNNSCPIRPFLYYCHGIVDVMELLVSQPWLRVQRRLKCRGVLDSVLVIARDNAAAANLGFEASFSLMVTNSAPASPNRPAPPKRTGTDI